MPKTMTSKEQDIAQEVIKAHGKARDQRGNWEFHWQEIAERVWPMQAKLFSGQKDSGISGEKRNQFIYDSTPVRSLNRFGAICDSLLTPRTQKWHRLVPTDPALKRDHAVMDYFETVNDILFRMRYAPKANFASQNQFTYKMLGGYGNSALFIDPLNTGLKHEKGLRYRNVHISELWFFENHQGLVDSCIRQTAVTARQLLQWFGEQNVPDDIIDMAKNRPEDTTHLYHCVKPRTDVDFGRRDSKGLPWASYYVIEKGAHLVEESGYETNPYAISRYEQAPNEVYGRSPAMDVLPSIKTLNEQKKTMLKQGHRAVDPVLLAHDDGVLDAFSLRPGAINPGGVTADGRPLVHALPTGNVQTGKEMMDDERADIKSAFLVDLFQILEETPEMTATEVMERVKEKGILLTPVLGRQESEYLGPMVERELSILNSLGLLPKPPPKLIQAGGDYHLEYDSPLSRSQKAEEAAGLLRTIESAINVATTTGNPEILDYFDWDEIIPEMSYINGVPTRWLKDPGAIAKIRAARQQQMQQEQAVRAAPGQAALAKAGANMHEKAPAMAKAMKVPGAQGG